MQVRDATVGPLSGTDRRIGLRPPRRRRTSMPSASHGDLREHRVRALADLGAGGEHADVAVGRRLDADDRGQVLFAGAGESGAVHEAGEADAAPDRAVGVLRVRTRARFA